MRRFNALEAKIAVSAAPTLPTAVATSFIFWANCNIRLVKRCDMPYRSSNIPVKRTNEFSNIWNDCPIVTEVRPNAVSKSLAEFNRPLTNSAGLRFFACSLNSSKGIPNPSAIAFAIMGIFSITERNSSPASLPDVKACESWIIPASASFVVAPDAATPLFTAVTTVSKSSLETFSVS